jgi:arylsulfatase A-like enzyme
MRLDKDLADFLNMLDETVGKGNYLLFLTADHGAAHNHNFMKKHKIPANGWNSGKRMNEWNHVLNEKFGADNLIVRVNEYKVYLNHKLIKSKGLDIDKVKAALTDIIREDDAVINAVDYAKISQSSVPELIRERIINGYNAKRSGDIYIIMRAQYFDSPEDIAYKGTSHGQWNPYDSHIPLVFMGWHIQHGKTATPVKMVDIAPTICDLIHIQMPNSCI